MHKEPVVQRLNIKWFSLQSEEPFTIKFRYSLNAMEGWKTRDFTSTRS